MNKSMSPVRAALSVGAIAGTVLASVVLLVGFNNIGYGMGIILDLLTAFFVGAVLAGPVAGVVQHYRLVKASEGSAAPGWYDSPEEDGTEWFWSGTNWTDRTRESRDRIRRIDTIS